MGKANLTGSEAKQGIVRNERSSMEANMRERSLRRSLTKSQVTWQKSEDVKNKTDKDQSKRDRVKRRRSTNSLGNGGLRIKRKSVVEFNIIESKSGLRNHKKKKYKGTKRKRNKNQRTIAIQTDPWDEPVVRKRKSVPADCKYVIRQTKARNINKTKAVVRNILTMEEYQLQSLKGCALLGLRFRISLKRLQEAVTKRQRRIYFESPSESSSSEDSVRDVYTSELDSEWLHSSQSEGSADLMEEYSTKTGSKKPWSPDDPLNKHCRKLTNAIGPYFWTLKLTGRMPWELYIEDKVQKFRFNPRNAHAVIFILTSIFLFVNTVLLCNTLLVQAKFGVSHIEEGYQREIERLTIDKWGYFAIVTLFALIYTCVWSAFVIFEDGKLIADYITRINMAVDVINYDASESLSRRVWFHPVWIGVYTVGFTILYFTDIVPAVRGASLLIGSAIIRPFCPNQVVVLNSYAIYKTAEVYGFLLHLYAALCARHISVLPTIYCKVIENMARFWNLRTTLTLQQVGYEDEEGRVKKLQVTIPLKKLWKEHTHIVAFLKQTGRVFNITLSFYLILKFLEFLILGYRAMAVLAFPLPTFSEEVVKVKLPENIPPIYYTDPPFLLRLAAIYIFAEGVIGWFITAKWIIDCGEAIMAGFELVRRYGFALAKSSKQRRFVASVQYAFGPPAHFFVQAVFTINREYLFETFCWVCTMIALFTAFAPVHLQTDLITVCNTNGTCVMVSSSRISMRTSGGNTINTISNISTTTPSVSTLQQTTTTMPTLEPTTLEPTPLIVETMPPLILINGKPTSIYHLCPTNGWNSAKYTTLKLPHACTGDGDKKLIDPEKRYPGPNTVDGNCVYDDNQQRMYSTLMSGAAGTAIFDCDIRNEQGNPLIQVARCNHLMQCEDDCGTQMFARYDTPSGWNPYPPRKPVAMPASYKNKWNILCCLNIGFEGPGEQLSFCNMPTPGYANKNCESGFEFGLEDMRKSTDPDIIRLHNYISRTPIQSNNPITNSANADSCLCGKPQQVYGPLYNQPQYVPRPKTIQDILDLIKSGTCNPSTW